MTTNTLTTYVEGPVSVLEIVTPGPQGPQGPAGNSTEALSHVHVQSTPSAEWTITHPLTFRPNVSVVDSAGSTVEGDVQYPNDAPDTIVVRFAGAFSGTAYMS